MSIAATATFHILHTATQTKIKDADDNLEVYETGAQAAQRAKELTEQTGEKHKPAKAPVVNDENWNDREYMRLYGPCASYIPVGGELSLYAPFQHYIHVSEDKPHLIAYTQNDEKGRADIQTRKSVSSYIKELREAGRCELTDEDITRIEAEHFAAYSAKVLFAKTPEEIISVYTNYDRRAPGVSDSCMRHDASEFSGHVHPVSVYGDSDLQIAYLANADGETTHRALVYPKEKLYSRVYGDSSAFHAALKKLGYQKSKGYYSGGVKSMAGARIRQIEDKNGNGYIMPYIDEVSNVGYLTDSEGAWFVFGEYGESCHETYGTTEEADCVRCESCEERLDGGESEVRTGRWAHEIWCADCVDNHAFYCYGREEYLSDHSYTSVDVDGSTYEEGYAQEYFNQCEHSDNYTRDDLVEVIIDASDGETQLWGPRALLHDAFYCRESGALYCHEQAKEGSLERLQRKSHGTYWKGVAVGVDEHTGDLVDEAELMVAAE